MSVGAKISAVLNTYNAEEHLEEVLRALSTFDEILVCDMESSDQTTEIARRHGARIVSFPHGDKHYCEVARDFAVHNAAHEWVLVVDADEIITSELRDYLYSRASADNAPDGLYIYRHNKIFGVYGRDFARDYQLRFFRKDKTTWPDTIHSVPIVEGTVEKAPAEYKMLHLADPDMHTWLRKLNEYTEGEAEKKKNKGYGIGALLYRPAWRFVKNYVLGGGYRNGIRGIMQAMQWAIYQQILVLKIMEKKVRKDA